MDPNSKRVTIWVARFAQEKKALEITILDLRQLTTLTDFFVIACGNSDVHIRAIADHISEGLEAKGVRIWHREGYAQARWVLIDAVEVIVHVFDSATRVHYGLERLWGDAPMKRIGEEEE